MKTIQAFKKQVRSIILCGAIALGAVGTLSAQWSEAPVSGVTEAISPRHGATDTVWNVFWCGSAASRLYSVQYAGSGFHAAIVATNFLDITNNLAVDSDYHWTYYTGTDGYIWLVYWGGSGWLTARVGTNVKYGYQLCVDPVYHLLWYVGNDNKLWVLYNNGVSWVESVIDGGNDRYRFNRSSGVDEGYHWVWNLSSDQKSLRFTYYNGTAWVSGTTPALPGTDLYQNLCVHGPTHQVYCLQSTSGFVPTQVQSLYWTASGWAGGAVFKDGNLPTSAFASSDYLICSPDSYACYLGDAANGGNANQKRCLFTGWSPTARAWATCRQDQPTWGGGFGLFPLTVGYGGRVVLCTPGNSAAGLKCMVSPY